MRDKLYSFAQGWARAIEHGQAERLGRIAASAVSYWLFALRMRARQQLAENQRA